MLKKKVINVKVAAGKIPPPSPTGLHRVKADCRFICAFDIHIADSALNAVCVSEKTQKFVCLRYLWPNHGEITVLVPLKLLDIYSASGHSVNVLATDAVGHPREAIFGRFFR